MTTTNPLGLGEMKQVNRSMWADGDFPAIAKRGLWPVGERIVKQIGVGPGDDVLDVACGTGNAAIRAAQAGGRVTGVDLTPELFDAGRAEAAAVGVSLDWVEGDAEDLPCPDESFDVVLSTFGVMFAPRHRTAAAELARVVRPGGRIGLCSWTPEGIQGEFFGVLGQYAPPLPPFADPPLTWGTVAHVQDLFTDTGVQLEFDRDAVLDDSFSTGYAAIDFMAANFGPLRMLRERLVPQGIWPDVRDRLAAIYGRGEPAEYLITLGRKS